MYAAITILQKIAMAVGFGYSTNAEANSHLIIMKTAFLYMGCLPESRLRQFIITPGAIDQRVHVKAVSPFTFSFLINTHYKCPNVLNRPQASVKALLKWPLHYRALQGSRVG